MSLRLFEGFGVELEYMLGKEGYAELLKMAADRAKASEQPSDTDPVPA